MALGKFEVSVITAVETFIQQYLGDSRGAVVSLGQIVKDLFKDRI